MNENRRHLVRLRPRAETLYVAQSRTVLATGRDGFIDEGSEHGLFVHQTRLLSRYRYLINDEPPQPIALSNVEQHSWLGYYATSPPDGGKDGTQGPGGNVAQQTIELRLSRFAGGGLHEDVDLTNFTQRAVAFTLRLEVDADFLAQSEVKGERKQRGQITRQWHEAGDGTWELAFDYHAEHEYDHQGDKGQARIHRGVTLRVERAQSAPSYENGCLNFRIELAPHARWHACINWIPYIDGETLSPLYGCGSFAGLYNERDLRRDIFLSEATVFTTLESYTLSSVVVGALEQAKRDLAALRLYDLDHGERAWTMAAGLPVYVALFGRDTLTAAWQAALAGLSMMEGTLTELARWQGGQINDWRDEQPGRMLHQAQNGPLEALNFNPHGRYYGSITTSGFYPVVVSELWHWTGDKERIRPFVETALKALRWLDEHSDLDGDGFYEYKTRSEQGLENQGWKDSGDAIVYEDGSQVKAPIATCEEQAFAYVAKLHMSEVLW